ncbi:MAG: hypothetical protein AMXMBFR57_23340 [Acidimicrobiia bacterium]
MNRAVVGLALVCAAACSGAVRMPGAITPVVPTESFLWSADRRLAWSDFQGPPDLSSVAVAATAYVVVFGTSCEGSTFSSTIESRFLPHASWVKAQHLMQRASAQTLLHEQVHFDLSEVQVRRARQAVRAIADPCSLSDQHFNEMFERFRVTETEVQQQYDRETGHGTNLDRQREWTAQVERWLRELPQ